MFEIFWHLHSNSLTIWRNFKLISRSVPDQFNEKDSKKLISSGGWSFCRPWRTIWMQRLCQKSKDVWKFLAFPLQFLDFITESRSETNQFNGKDWRNWSVMGAEAFADRGDHLNAKISMEDCAEGKSLHQTIDTS